MLADGGIDVVDTLASGVQYTTKSPIRSASISAWKLLSFLPRLSVTQRVFCAMPSSSVESLKAAQQMSEKFPHDSLTTLKVCSAKAATERARLQELAWVPSPLVKCP